MALGVPIALFGLTAFIFSQINSLFFKRDTYHFLLFIAISTGSFIFLGSIFLIKLLPEESREEEVLSDEEILFSPSSPSSSTSLHDDERAPLLSSRQQQQRNVESEPDIGGWELLQNMDAILICFIKVLMGGMGLMYFNNVGIIIKTLYLSSNLHGDVQNFQNFHVALLSILSSFGRISIGIVSDIAKYKHNFGRLWFFLLACL